MVSNGGQMERNDGVRRLLLRAPAYRAAQHLIGGRRSGEKVHREIIRSSSTSVVVDIGCGTCDIADDLPCSQYTGFDPNPAYISEATARLAPRLGDRSRLFVGSIGEAGLRERLPERADLVIAIGVLHHVDDHLAGELLALAADLLGNEGRFVSLDPAYAPDQPRLARFLASRDRGQFVRTAADVSGLVSQHFNSVETSVRHDLLRVPYTHVTITARNA